MKINRAFIKGTNWALAGLISMLGFAGCRESEPIDEYGSPLADYTVKGAVVNKADGKPIEGIQVAIGYPYNEENMSYIDPELYLVKTDSMTTNAKGEFKLTNKSIYDLKRTMPVFVQDIDGEKNGLFQSDTLHVDFSKAEHSGKQKDWYYGEFTVTLNVELNKIDPENP